jgi:hypothetical protein
MALRNRSALMPHDEHPDLRQVMVEAINELMQKHDFQATQPREPVTLEQVEIRHQKLIQHVRTLNDKLNGGDLAASIALVTQGTSIYPWLFVTCRRAGEDNWQPVASVSGEGSKNERHRFLGKTLGPRSFVCVGSLNVIPDGGRIRIELPDGNVYEEPSVDGCCVVLAPVMFAPDIGEPTTIRYFDADGSEINSETVC